MPKNGRQSKLVKPGDLVKVVETKFMTSEPVPHTRPFEILADPQGRPLQVMVIENGVGHRVDIERRDGHRHLDRPRSFVITGITRTTMTKVERKWPDVFASTGAR